VSLDFNAPTLSDYGKSTLVRVNSDQFITPFGTVIVPSRRAANGHYQMFDGSFVHATGELRVAKLYTANRGMGLGPEIMSRAIEAIGPEKVKSISGELGIDNLDVYQANLKQGMSPIDAARNTPAAAIRTKLGYGNISFDPASMIITGSRQ
jgi:hypothetical protein